MAASGCQWSWQKEFGNVKRIPNVGMGEGNLGGEGMNLRSGTVKRQREDFQQEDQPPEEAKEVEEGRKLGSGAQYIKKRRKAEVRCGNWSILPDIILDKVFTYLPLADRVAASQVCCNWSRTIHNPNLWRVLMINRHRATPESLKKYLFFTKRCGHHLRYLEFECPQFVYKPITVLHADLAPQIITIFDNLRDGSELTSFRLRDFNAYYQRSQRYAKSLCDQLRKSVLHFLETQHTLSEVEMTRFKASVEEGTLLLQTIANSSGTNLRTLLLDDFFYRENALVFQQNKNYLSTMANFKHLEKIVLHYDYISEEMLRGLTHNCAGRLRSMVIICPSLHICSHTIGNEVWKELKLVCPEVLVDFIIREFQMFNDSLEMLLWLIPSEVPLRLFAMHYLNPYLSNPFKLSYLYHLLRPFQDTLEDLELNFMRGGLRSSESALKGSLLGLKNLKRVKIKACLSLSVVEEVSISLSETSIQENVISFQSMDLQKFNIVVQNLKLVLGEGQVSFDRSYPWVTIKINYKKC